MKKSVMIGIELTLFCMIVGTLVSYAAGSNPPSNGVRYGSTTVQSALDDLYNKISSGSTSCLPTRTPDTSTIAVGGSRTYSSGTYANSWTVSCANKTCPTCPSCSSCCPSNGNNIGWKSLYYKAGSTTTSSTFSYTFGANYDAVLIVMVVADGQTDGSDYRNVTFTGNGFTKVSDKGAGSRHIRQIMYFAKGVKSGTSINFVGTQTGNGEMHIYALSGVSSVTEIYADYKQGNSTINLFQFTGNKASKNAICAISNSHDGSEYTSSVLPIIYNSGISTASVTYIPTPNGKIKERRTSVALINNPSTSDYLSSTAGTGDLGVIACLKLN